MLKNRYLKWFYTLILAVSAAGFSCGFAVGQSKPATLHSKKVEKSSSQILSFDKIKIDSLEAELQALKFQYNITDSLYEAERFTTADLRDQMIKLDDYRKKLEGNIGSYKGENLKLNQSNRILIVFNSLVAVLLVISLVFFLKKMGSGKRSAASNSIPDGSVASSSKASNLSLEEKLQQLERLGKLREKGLLSENEFLAEKQNILGK
jgi:hypothetical protein